MARLLAFVAVAVLGAGLGTWLATRGGDGGDPRAAVDHWLHALATDDPGEFCATTTELMQDTNFADAGARSGSCETRASVLLGEISPAWAPFRGARATRASADGAAARVAAADIVLPDGTRMSEWSFGGVPHPDKAIRVIRAGGTWRVDG